MRDGRKSVVIVGCGNVAWHLAKRLSESERFAVRIFNHRNNSALVQFRKELKCETPSSLEQIPHDADYYFLCVPDAAIAEIASHLAISNPKSVLMHCAGSVPVEALGKRIHGTGVFYPLQTF